MGAFYGILCILARLKGLLGRLGAVLGVSWGILGASRDLLGRLGRHLGASGGVLGALGRVLGRVGSVLGASWERLGSVLGAPSKKYRKNVEETLFFGGNLDPKMKPLEPQK